MKVEALVCREATGDYEAGDIVKICPVGHPWGKKEGLPRYQTVELDADNFYDIRNLELALDDSSMAKFPAAVRKDLKRLAQYARARKPKVLKARRYRVNAENEVEDKVDGRRVKRIDI